MKKLTLIIAFLMMFSGCSDKSLILVPQSNYHPTFPTSEFHKSEKVKIDMWVEREEVNGSTKEYLVADKNDMMSFIKNVKDLRSNYNILLNRINDFNTKIKEQNTNQNTKQKNKYLQD